jgi:predicted nucleic acid-binding protein
MILVDSSVWVDFFNGKSTPQTLFLRDRADRTQIAVGDLILCEVLQGFRDSRAFANARELLLSFAYHDMVGREIALLAAENFRTLRKRGVTVRKTIDVLIASFCLVKEFQLLHSDRDFDPMQEKLGLRVVAAG